MMVFSCEFGFGCGMSVVFGEDGWEVDWVLVWMVVGTVVMAVGCRKIGRRFAAGSGCGCG